MSRLLEENGFEVAGQAGDGDELVRKVMAHKPDVAIVDVRMPPTHTDEGLRAAQQIREELPDVGVLVLSQYVEEEYATELLADRAEGVGYLLKDRVADVDVFTDAVRRVADGGSAGSPGGTAAGPPRSRSGSPAPRAGSRARGRRWRGGCSPGGGRCEAPRSRAARPPLQA